MTINHIANAVRAPAVFSETIDPIRTMVVDSSGAPVGLGIIRARHTLYGKLTGYFVEFDDGTRMTISPSQIRDPDNVVMPAIMLWRLAPRACPIEPPSGAA